MLLVEKYAKNLEYQDESKIFLDIVLGLETNNRFQLLEKHINKREEFNDIVKHITSLSNETEQLQFIDGFLIKQEKEYFFLVLSLVSKIPRKNQDFIHKTIFSKQSYFKKMILLTQTYFDNYFKEFKTIRKDYVATLKRLGKQPIPLFSETLTDDEFWCNMILVFSDYVVINKGNVIYQYPKIFHFLGSFYSEKLITKLNKLNSLPCCHYDNINKRKNTEIPEIEKGFFDQLYSLPNCKTGRIKHILTSSDISALESIGIKIRPRYYNYCAYVQANDKDYFYCFDDFSEFEKYKVNEAVYSDSSSNNNIYFHFRINNYDKFMHRNDIYEERNNYELNPEPLNDLTLITSINKEIHKSLISYDNNNGLIGKIIAFDLDCRSHCRDKTPTLGFVYKIEKKEIEATNQECAQYRYVVSVFANNLNTNRIGVCELTVESLATLDIQDKFNASLFYQEFMHSQQFMMFKGR